MKAVITIEDEGDAVCVKSTPSYGEIMEMIGDRAPTAAECYLLAALNRMRDLSKSAMLTQQVIQIPQATKRGPKLVTKE